MKLMLLDLEAQLSSLQITHEQLYLAHREKTKSLESAQAKYLSLKARAMAGEMQSAVVSDDAEHTYRAPTTQIFPEHTSRSQSRVPSAMNRWPGMQGVIPGMSRPPSTPTRGSQEADGIRHGPMGPPARPPRRSSRQRLP